MEQEKIQQWQTEFMNNRHGLMAFIMGLVRDPHAAEDIFQEVWVTLSKATEQDLAVEHVGKWCRGVARNLILRRWSEQKQERLVVDSEIVELADQAFEEHDATRDRWQARRQALFDCIESLPEHSREVLRLKYEMDLTAAAIAEQLKKTVGSVLTMLSRLREALFDCVENRLHAEGVAS